MVLGFISKGSVNGKRTLSSFLSRCSTENSESTVSVEGLEEGAPDQGLGQPSGATLQPGALQSGKRRACSWDLHYCWLTVPGNRASPCPPASVLPRHKEAVPAEDPRTSRPVLANNREALLLPDLYQEYLVGRTRLPPRSLAARKSGGDTEMPATSSPHCHRALEPSGWVI